MIKYFEGSLQVHSTHRCLDLYIHTIILLCNTAMFVAHDVILGPPNFCHVMPARSSILSLHGSSHLIHWARIFIKKHIRTSKSKYFIAEKM